MEQRQQQAKQHVARVVLINWRLLWATRTPLEANKSKQSKAQHSKSNRTERLCQFVPICHVATNESRLISRPGRAQLKLIGACGGRMPTVDWREAAAAAQVGVRNGAAPLVVVWFASFRVHHQSRVHQLWLSSSSSSCCYCSSLDTPTGRTQRWG